MATDRIRRALDAAGYTDSPATATALRECWEDYADALGVDLDDEDPTTEDMCRDLLRYCKVRRNA